MITINKVNSLASTFVTRQESVWHKTEPTLIILIKQHYCLLDLLSFKKNWPF